MRLGIEEKNAYYVIGWINEAEDIYCDLCLGAIIKCRKRDSEQWKREAEEHNHLTNEIKKLCPPDGWDRANDAFYWESLTDARKALGVARSLLKQFKDGRPWPDWAKEAVAHGWKPPRGWTP